jgi:prevent-host-death family protein
MKRVQIARLKDRLSEHVRAAERGEEFVVTDRDRPVARLVPAATVDLALIPAEVPFARVRDRRYPPTNWSVGAAELLAEERAER